MCLRQGPCVDNRGDEQPGGTRGRGTQTCSVSLRQEGHRVWWVKLPPLVLISCCQTPFLLVTCRVPGECKEPRLAVLEPYFPFPLPGHPPSAFLP